MKRKIFDGDPKQKIQLYPVSERMKYTSKGFWTVESKRAKVERQIRTKTKLRPWSQNKTENSSQPSLNEPKKGHIECKGIIYNVPSNTAVISRN